MEIIVFFSINKVKEYFVDLKKKFNRRWKDIVLKGHLWLRKQ